MIAIYSTTHEALQNIVGLLLKETDEHILIAENQEDIPDLIKSRRPKTVFLFMPQRTGTAIEIQTYIRAVLPRCRVRILPTLASTDQLHPIWPEVALRALKPRAKRRKKSKEDL